MAVIAKILQPMKPFFKELTSSYLNSAWRWSEFTLYTIAYIFFTVLIIIGPQETKGLTAMVQSLIAVFLALRFTYLGLMLFLLFSARDYYAIISLLIQTHNMDYAMGIVIRSVTILSVIIITILSYKKDSHQKHLHQLSITDDLTGLFNQRFFHQRMEQAIEQAKKSSNPLGLILIDIDNFKMINNVYGHTVGDKILKLIGEFLNGNPQENAALFRSGGDEFAIIVVGATPETLDLSAKQLRADFNKYVLQHKSKIGSHDVTVSMGLSQFPEISSDKDELISHAEMALYHAKNLGRDKVHFYKDVMAQIRKGVNTDHQHMIGVFKTLLSAVSTKDQYTLIHSERVADYAVSIGEALGMSPKEISILQYAGLLHDIGKIEIPRSVLNKTEPLTNEEYQLIRLHPVNSAHILEPLDSMGPLIDYVRHHHERLDGKGYPDGLTSSNISLGARILCVADAFDAMLSERPYKKSLSIDEAFEELQRCAGTQFDPNIVYTLITVMKHKLTDENRMIG